MDLNSLSLEEFSKEVASSSPAPGGGSVAAYAGAQGYALMAMVCRLTIGREKFASVQEQMKERLAGAEAKQERLLALVDEDTQGFKGVMQAFALAKDTEEEKALRRKAIEEATLQAALIPLKTAKLCLEGLREIPWLIQHGNSNAMSDMGVAALMFSAGLEGALYNVQINTVALKKTEDRDSLLATCASLREEGNRLAKEIHEEVLQKIK